MLGYFTHLPPFSLMDDLLKVIILKSRNRIVTELD